MQYCDSHGMKVHDHPGLQEHHRQNHENHKHNRNNARPFAIRSARSSWRPEPVARSGAMAQHWPTCAAIAADDSHPTTKGTFRDRPVAAQLKLVLERSIPVSLNTHFRDPGVAAPLTGREGSSPVSYCYRAQIYAGSELVTRYSSLLISIAERSGPIESQIRGCLP